MALVQRFVNPASTAGGDGTTNATTGANRAYIALNEWSAGEATDLVADGDTHQVQVDTGTDTTTTTLSGWTTDATHDVRIFAASGAEHNGKSRDNTGTGYQLAGGGGSGLVRNSIAHLTIEDLEFKSVTSTAFVASATVSGSDVNLNRCLLLTSGTGSAYALNISLANLNISMLNCLVVANARGLDSRNAASLTVDHCTVWAEGTLGIVSTSEATVTNTAVFNASSECFFTGGAAPSGSHNAASDSSVSTDYTSVQASLTDTDQFVSPSSTFATFDFSIKDSGSALVDNGTGSNNDTVDNQTRSAPVDIGCFELASSATSTLTGTMLATVDEDDLTGGGKTVIATITGDTFKAAGTGPVGSIADTQAFIDGINAASSPTNGWNNEVRDKALVTEVARTDNNTLTWTVAAQAGYDVSAQEVIECIIPVDVLVIGAAPITATPTFTIDAVSGFQVAWARGSNTLIQGGIA